MKKRVSALALALALIFSISAAAAEARYSNYFSHTEMVSASGSGVSCTVSVKPKPGVRLAVSGTVTLYKNGNFVKSWSVSSLKFNETYSPSGKGTYRMDYDITVKGPAGSDHLIGSKSSTY